MYVMRKTRKILSVLLAVLLMSNLGILFNTAKAAEPEQIIINQAYGSGPLDGSGSISHSFVELYNMTDSPVNLKDWSLQLQNGNENSGTLATEWEKLDFSSSHVIQPYSSFLIRLHDTRTGGVNSTRYVVSNSDVDWTSARIMSNRAYSVALVNNQTLLSKTISSAEMQGIVDLVGAKNTGSGDVVLNCEGTPLTGVSKQKAVRRISFQDTDDNSADFEPVDYRTSGMNDAKLEDMRPRWSGDGQWNQDIIPVDVELNFSHEAGTYAQDFYLSLSTNYSDGVIRYTTDGKDPTASSAEYNNSIFIEERTSYPNDLSKLLNTPTGNVFKGNVIKAQVFSIDGKPLTDVYTNSYFINAQYGNLPIVSIVTDRANFEDSDIGLFVNGNFYQRGSNWERPIHFELFEPDGTTGLSFNAGVRINGGATRTYSQKSLRIYAKAGYDAEHPTVEYDLFDGNAQTADWETLTTFKRFLLRNGGQDNRKTMFRDPLIQSLAHDTYAPAQGYRQSAVFINGEFWGVYNLRERVDDESILRKYKLDKTSNIGCLSFAWGCNNWPEDYDASDADMVKDYQSYMEMWNWFNDTSSLATDATYQKAQTFLDLDNFIDYHIINMFANNTDWPSNNLELFRYRTDEFPADASAITQGDWKDGRWRWHLKDTDFGFNGLFDSFTNESLYGVHHDMFSFLTDPNKRVAEYNTPWGTMIFRKLITNEDFRERFANRYCDLLNTNFKSDVVLDKINEMANNIAGVMQQQINRWNTISSYNTWLNNVNVVRKFAEERPSYVYTHMKNAFGLQETANLTLKTDSGLGYISLNGRDINEKTDGVTNPDLWTGTYYKGLTQTITATPNEGFYFVKFVVGDQEYYTETIDIELTDDTTVQAIFENDSSFVPVSAITGVPSEAAVGVETPLNAVVVPSRANNKTIIWSVKNAGTTGATINNGVLQTTKTGTAVITAVIKNGLTETTDFVKDFTISVIAYTPVTRIAGVPTEISIGSSMTLDAMVLPVNASNKSIVWSIVDQRGTGASISGSRLTTTLPGVVIVRATIQGGMSPSEAYTQDFFIKSDVPGDKAKLQKLFDTASKYRQEMFEDGYGDFHTARTHAGTVLAELVPTVKEVQQAYDDLLAAMSALVTVGDNVAYVAEPSCSYEKNAGTIYTINDGLIQLDNVSGTRWSTWGNTSSSEWLMYSWPTGAEIHAANLFICTDGAGLMLPSDYVFEYLPIGGKTWVKLDGEGFGLADNDKVGNITTFDETVQARALRVTLNKQANDNNGVAAWEWEVYGTLLALPEEENIALSGDASCSYVSAWESLDAINDGQVPLGNANSTRWGTWGHASASEWLMYSWPTGAEINATNLFICDNMPPLGDGGLKPTTGYIYEYLPLDSDNWVKLDGEGFGLETNTATGNTTTFAKTVRARALRVTLDKPANDSTGVAVWEWEVYGRLLSAGDTYQLTVNGGSGSGQYEKEDVVNITALVPEGKRFVEWISDSDVIFANASYESTSMLMPGADTVITAIFEDIDEPENISIDDRLVIEFDSISDDTFDPCFNITPKQDMAVNLIVSAYDSNGCLIDVNSQNAQLESGKKQTLQASIPVEPGRTYKFFIWDDALVPLTEITCVDEL